MKIPFFGRVADPVGLGAKYEVTKDGEPIDGPCFVLRPDRDKAARKALRVYALWTDNDQLADDLLDWCVVLDRAAETGEQG